jgi:hypothetical protein
MALHDSLQHELECAFCDHFSTTQPITLNKISLVSLGQCRQSPVKISTSFAYFQALICIEKYDPFTLSFVCFAFITAVFALICDSCVLRGLYLVIF